MQGRTYRVKAGDSLSSIAKHQLGNAVFWPRIYAYNNRSSVPRDHRLPHADKLRVGQVLLLPPPEPPEHRHLNASLRSGQGHAKQATHPSIPATTVPASSAASAVHPTPPPTQTPSPRSEGKPLPASTPTANDPDTSEKTQVNSFPFKYNLDLIPEQKLDGGSFEATLKFQGVLVVWIDKQIPLTTFTNKGAELAAKSESDMVVGRLLTQTKVSWDRSSNKVSFEDLMTTQAKGFPESTLAVGLAVDSLNPIPAFRAKFTAPKLEGRIGQSLYYAENVTVTLDLRPKNDDDITRRPNLAPARQPSWASGALQSVRKHGLEIAAGTLILGAVVLAGAAVASNFVTFGTDTPVDIPAFAGSAAMISAASRLTQ